MIAPAQKRNYSLIGRILYKTLPEVASQLENALRPGTETDLQRIFFLYSRFDGFELPGYNAVNRRRIFTAIMLKLYHPHCFESGIINLKYGFVRNIAVCFGCISQSITRNVREVIIMYRAYQDFGDKVNELTELLKSQK